jgi:biotin synthase
MIAGVKALGLETCATLGMLTADQAKQLKAAGLDYYNHNLDTGPEYYAQVVTTRTYQDRLDTLQHVRDAGMKTCCGGIVGMGESRRDRASLLHALATLPEHPDSLPVNALVPVSGTPLGERVKREGEIDPIEFVRTVAVARSSVPKPWSGCRPGRET